MIGTTLLYIIYGFIYVVTLPLRLLPDVSLSSEISDSIYTVAGYINSLEPFVPVSELYSIFLFLVGFNAFILAYKLIMWTIKRFPTQS